MQRASSRALAAFVVLLVLMRRRGGRAGGHRRAGARVPVVGARRHRRLRLPQQRHADRRHVHVVPHRFPERAGRQLLDVPQARRVHREPFLAELGLQPRPATSTAPSRGTTPRSSRTARTRTSAPRRIASAATARAPASPIRARAPITISPSRASPTAAPATPASPSMPGAWPAPPVMPRLGVPPVPGQHAGLHELHQLPRDEAPGQEGAAEQVRHLSQGHGHRRRRPGAALRDRHLGKVCGSCHKQKLHATALGSGITNCGTCHKSAYHAKQKLPRNSTCQSCHHMAKRHTNGFRCSLCHSSQIHKVRPKLPKIRL